MDNARPFPYPVEIEMDPAYEISRGEALIIPSSLGAIGAEIVLSRRRGAGATPSSSVMLMFNSTERGSVVHSMRAALYL